MTERIEDVPGPQQVANQIKREISELRLAGLALLRAPFPAHQISKLPKPTKQQTDEVKADYRKGIRCEVCGAWHHPKVVHLDYVGHAALTHRLLDADPEWNWAPVSAADNYGLPVIAGGLWIRLTVCGVTRLGFGHAEGKTGGDAIKEVIGDALRNAAMRFGCALDLWHKGQLYDDEAEEPRFKSAVQATIDQGIDVAEARRRELDAIGSQLTDLVQQEQSDKVDNEWKIWELMEPIKEQDDALYLSTLCSSTVRARIKEVADHRRAEKRAEPKPESTGLKTYKTRAMPVQ